MRNLFFAMMASAAFAALSGPVSANPTFTLGNNPPAGGTEENVLFTTNQTATTVTGYTNQTNTLVQFSSTTDTLNVTANGQANMTSLDGFINDVTMSIPNGTFTDAILDPQGPACTSLTSPTDCTGNSSTGATVTVVASDGTYHYALTIGNGNNFFTVVAAAGELIDSVTIDSNTAVIALGFEDLKQPRISGAIDAVPEPATLALFGGALLGMAGFVRRRRQEFDAAA